MEAEDDPKRRKWNRTSSSTFDTIRWLHVSNFDDSSFLLTTSADEISDFMDFRSFVILTLARSK